MKIKKQADYYVLRKFQDLVTSSINFDRGVDTPDEKFTEMSNTIDDLIDKTDSTNILEDSTDSLDVDTTTGESTTSKSDLSTHQRNHVARSGKPLRYRNKEDCEHEQTDIYNDYDYPYKLQGGNANNGKLVPDYKERGAKKLFNNYHHKGGNNLQENIFLDNDFINENEPETYYTKGSGPFMNSKNFKSSFKSLGVSHSNIPSVGNTHANALGIWDGAHSKLMSSEKSHSGNASILEGIYGTGSKTHNENDDSFNSGPGSHTHLNWEAPNSNFNSGLEPPPPDMELPKSDSNFREYSSNHNDYIGDNVHNDYTKHATAEIHDNVHDDYMKQVTAELQSRGISSGGLPFKGDTHKRNNKNNRIIINNNNNNNNNGGGRGINNNNNNNNGFSSGINNNNNNNNNGRSRKIIPGSRYDGRSNNIIDNKEVDEKKKKKLSLISFNSVHTNNNINNNNNAAGAVNVNDINKGNIGNKDIVQKNSGQNNCWYVVCVGLYVNDAKFSPPVQNKT